MDGVCAELIDDPEVLKLRQQTIDDELRNLSIIQPYGYILSDKYVKFHRQIQDFEVFDDDVWVATYPKCGTRWMQELVWCVRNNFDLAKAKTKPVDHRVPFFDYNVIDNKLINSFDSFDVVKNMTRPRTIKTHFPYDMLPKQTHQTEAKIINVVRNPRDVCLSLLNHFQILENYSGGLETIADVFTRDLGFNWGPFFKNVLSYWNKRLDDENLLIVSYEEMQQDLPLVIEKVSEFLNVTATHDNITKLSDHLSFKSMKANPMTNLDSENKKCKQIKDGPLEPNKSMMNKGKSGRWKEIFSPQMIKQFEDWERKWLTESDLKLTFEIN